MKCLNCDSEISEKRKFCSLSCSVTYNNKKRERKITISKCLNCEKEIEGRKQFCNHSCSASYNNKKRVKRDTKEKEIKVKKEKKFCLNCNEELDNKYKKYKKFCNNQCSNEFRYKDYIRKWKEGIVNGMRGDDQISEHIRKYLLEKYNNKCCECEWSKINPYTKKIPLEVEHIDGNNKNNKEENLKILCPSCHSLTKTYKGANRGNGRYERRMRYKRKMPV